MLKGQLLQEAGRGIGVGDSDDKAVAGVGPLREGVFGQGREQAASLVVGMGRRVERQQALDRPALDARLERAGDIVGREALAVPRVGADNPTGRVVPIAALSRSP